MKKERIFPFLYYGIVIGLVIFMLSMIFQNKKEDQLRTPVILEKDTEIPTKIPPTQVNTPTPIDLGKNKNVINVSSDESIQKAVDGAQPGDTINLLPGIYEQDVITKRSGTGKSPIIIAGTKEAIVKGGGKARIFEINHDYITLSGFTIDGQHSSSNSKEGYRDKLIYALGKGEKKGVTGLKIMSMEIKNAGGECIRLRYFAQKNEIAYNTITRCGVVDFEFKGGGKNGEGIYIGTAPEQLKDDKNPTADTDESNNNWIHHNTINTQGNECVDIKEGSSGNIVEHNNCTGQKDKESAGLDSRGNNNVFRYNEIYGNLGAGIRFGGDEDEDGINNDAYDNTIRNNENGGIKFQRKPQGKVCENNMSDNKGGNSVGSESDDFNPDARC